ncbi:uncharacterized protein ACN2A1_009849 isoform 1-T1 [Glossina fuscipes fuscipes]
MHKFLIYLLLADGLRSNGLWANKSWLHIDNSYDVFLNRQKRYLLFEKSAAVTFQGFVGKSIVSETPRGLNQIVEYTLMYELPTEIQLLKTKKASNTTLTIAVAPAAESYPIVIPYHPSFNKHKKYSYYHGSRRNWSPNRLNTKSFKRNLYEYVNIGNNVCQERIKKHKRLQRQLKFDNAGQRMLYDILEQWSLMHGFMPHYCFMRTLCEATHMLMPYGYSLFHDIISILLSYVQPWAEQYATLGRSLRHRDVVECAQYYGPHCRVSWLHYITAALHDKHHQ